MVEGGAQRSRALPAHLVGLGDRRHQRRKSDVHREVGHAERGECRPGNRDNLDIGSRPRRADQFGADLTDLPLGPDLRAPDPQHLAGIAEPQRSWRSAEPSGGDARNLRCHVGAHTDHAVRDGIHHAEGRHCHRRPGAREQRLLELDERRLDPLVAMRGQCRHQLRHNPRFDFGLGRQQIVHAGRQQGGVRCLAHNAGSVAELRFA